jgi:phosphatidylglycerol:prolipoprotein diacylglycerol transferase
MIPYIAQPRFHAMGLTFYAFGFLVAMALLAGWRMLRGRARRFGLDRGKVERLTFHMLWWGYYGSHVLYLVLFRREELALRPWLLLKPLDGIYSFGGIVCALLAALWFARRYQFTRTQFWRYLDAAGFVFPFSWTIARTGCAMAHDHVGVASTTWIAVRFPGGPRLDLGLIEALFTACLALCFLALDRRDWPAPFFCGLLFVVYGSFRLWLDTLHTSPATPDRVFGWGAVALGCVLLILAWRHRKQPGPAT